MLIGKRLRRWRDAENLSGPEAGERAGLTWPELRVLETGAAEGDAHHLELMAKSYGRTLAELTGPTLAEERPPVRDPDDRPQHLQERSPYRPGVAALDDTGTWHLRPGDTIARPALHARYGGSARTDISPSKTTRNVFLFSDPGSERPGDHDSWDDETGTFRYRGEGNKGDQSLEKGNLAVLDHVAERRTLRLFEGVEGRVTYAGAFTVDPEAPYETVQAPDPASGAPRQVLVFRLLPVRP